MPNWSAYVREALDLSKGPLESFIRVSMQSIYGDHYVHKEPRLRSTALSLSSGSGTPRSLDNQSLLRILLDHWAEVFARRLSGSGRRLVHEVKSARNSWAHEQEFTFDSALQAVDSCMLLVKATDESYSVVQFAELKQRMLSEVAVGSTVSAPYAEPLQAVPVAPTNEAFRGPILSAMSVGQREEEELKILRDFFTSVLRLAEQGVPITSETATHELLRQRNTGRVIDEPEALRTFFSRIRRIAQGGLPMPDSVLKELQQASDALLRCGYPALNSQQFEAAYPDTPEYRLLMAISSYPTSSPPPVQFENTTQLSPDEILDMYGDGEDLAVFFEALGFEVIDKRPQRGAVWVVGDNEELTEIMKGLAHRYAVRFAFAPEGGRASGHQPAWYSAT